jgi:GTP1/Obg family GTP-binding protein
MSLSEEEKANKKVLAKYKRKVTEIAGVVHDIVEDTLWSEYDKLPQLSEDIVAAMKDVNEFKKAHPYLK